MESTKGVRGGEEISFCFDLLVSRDEERLRKKLKQDLGKGRNAKVLVFNLLLECCILVLIWMGIFIKVRAQVGPHRTQGGAPMARKNPFPSLTWHIRVDNL